MYKRIFIFVIISFIFSQDKVYFVYNAENDFISVMGDFFHKSLSPKTYPCSLCGLTYGLAFKKKIWRNFLDSLEFSHEFLYRNQLNGFNEGLGELPTVLIGNKENFTVLLSSDEMNKMKNIDELIENINIKLNLLKDE